MKNNEINDMVPEPFEELPILAFLCHPHSKEKAIKTITAMAATIEEKPARQEILNLPVKGLKGTPKNILIAATTDDREVFRVNMKTGESHYE